MIASTLLAAAIMVLPLAVPELLRWNRRRAARARAYRATHAKPWWVAGEGPPSLSSWWS